MSNDEWWAAERKAAEFWRELMANQSGAREHGGQTVGIGAATTAQDMEFGAPMQQRMLDIPLRAPL